MSRLVTVALAARVAILALAGLDLVHPLLHHIEGGSLDSMLMYAHVWAMNVLPFASLPQEG